MRRLLLTVVLCLAVAVPASASLLLPDAEVEDKKVILVGPVAQVVETTTSTSTAPATTVLATTTTRGAVLPVPSGWVELTTTTTTTLPPPPTTTKPPKPLERCEVVSNPWWPETPGKDTYDVEAKIWYVPGESKLVARMVVKGVSERLLFQGGSQVSPTYCFYWLEGIFNNREMTRSWVPGVGAVFEGEVPCWSRSGRVSYVQLWKTAGHDVFFKTNLFAFNRMPPPCQVPS